MDLLLIYVVWISTMLARENAVGIVSSFTLHHCDSVEVFLK